jgi:hypothetical protein
VRRNMANLLLLLGLSACADGDRRSPMCGLAMLTGPLVALEGFARGDALITPPADLPPIMAGRFVAGPLVEVLMSRDADGLLLAAIDGPQPEAARPGFGVLLIDRSRQPLGVLIHDGLPVSGATRLGTIEVGDSLLPLLGVLVTPEAIETPECRMFSDE